MEDNPLDFKIYGIDHIAHGVFISGWRATQQADYLHGIGLMYMLKLYEDSPYWPTDFTVCNNVLTDGEPVARATFQQGVDFIREHIVADHPVLVQCGAGVSRSSTFVLAYLLDRGYDLPDAWKLLKKCHPQANPHPQLWESLISHYGLPYKLNDLVNW